MNKILHDSPLRGWLCLQWTPPLLGGQKNLATFHSWRLCRHLFLALVLWAGEPCLVFRSHPSRKKLLWLKYPSGTSAATHGTAASPIVCPPLLVLTWLVLQVLDYKTPLQLALSWLFRVIIPQFSCASSLALGGGKYKIHLLHCHLESP